MSNKSLEQALANLLPTHAEALPPELVKHAASLLAQSRTYGSSLKPEEEIARPLRKSLKLPSPLGRPPCPPRVYKKIYTYLEQALLKSSKTTSSAPNTPRKPIGTSSSLRTPSKNNSPAVTTAPNGSPLKRPLPTTPPQRAARDHNRTKVALRGKGSNGISSHSSVKDAPSWTMPLIRRICKTSATSTASSASPTRPSFSTGLPPHIFAGVSSILSYISETEPQRGKNQTQFISPLIASMKTTPGMHEPGSNDDKIYRDRITTLIVAVYFVVLTRMHRGIAQSSTYSTLPPAENWDVDTYLEMAAAALTVVGLEGKTYVNDVDMWLSIIMTQNWTVGTEWFDNIPSPSKGGEGVKGNRGEGLAKRAGNGNDDDDDDDEIVSPQKRRVIRRQNQRRGENRDAKAQGGLQPGLGTMMQDRLNWLSEDIREDYLEWKEGVMKRIHAIEKGMAAS
ncbi:origin recognition complex subunit 6 (ORC6) [Histoplasma capsulatum]|uniref:Origin recognition complex subunit 6 (ORC6) n=1 Tax=Ajellomyces capsulatus TaxID=5037 RepID=A0A8A1ME62_AJECA|nr:origin recognition complex subunit 6 (ORC6) [Histoplasma capsulatum]